MSACWEEWPGLRSDAAWLVLYRHETGGNLREGKDGNKEQWNSVQSPWRCCKIVQQLTPGYPSCHSGAGFYVGLLSRETDMGGICG